MSSTVITYNFSKGSISTELARLPDQIDMGVKLAVEEAADFAKAMAKIYVRVDTGSLQQSIRKERVSAGPDVHAIRIRAGGYIMNPKTGRFVDYAGFVESHYPFMQPARDMVENMLRSLLADKVMERI